MVIFPYILFSPMEKCIFSHINLKVKSDYSSENAAHSDEHENWTLKVYNIGLSDRWPHSCAVFYIAHELAGKHMSPVTSTAPLKCLRLNIWVRVLWVRTKFVLVFCLVDLIQTGIPCPKRVREQEFLPVCLHHVGGYTQAF